MHATRSSVLTTVGLCCTLHAKAVKREGDPHHTLGHLNAVQHKLQREGRRLIVTPGREIAVDESLVAAGARRGVGDASKDGTTRASGLGQSTSNTDTPQALLADLLAATQLKVGS